MKMSLQYHMQAGDQTSPRDTFIAFHNGYHGDTLGAASLGGVEAFFERFRKLGLEVHFVRDLEGLNTLSKEILDKVAGVIIEPLVQGVNEIHVWPEGMLAELRRWTDARCVHLILDEVMTGFGRTGEMFACQNEQVIPDFLCLAKGISGGYLPFAATLTRECIYEVFKGDASKAFYYGHSYTANPLGCAAALASLEIFDREQTLVAVRERGVYLQQKLFCLMESSAHVYAVRRCGLIAGVELRQVNGEKFSRELRVGEKVCLIARKYQLLTRPILDTIVLMPPLCITRDELDVVVSALEMAIEEVMNEFQ